MSEEIINNNEEEITQPVEKALPEGVIKLTADDGYMYTDQNRQIVSKTLYVVEDLKDTFVQITEEEGKELQEQIKQNLENLIPKFSKNISKPEK